MYEHIDFQIHTSFQFVTV